MGWNAVLQTWTQFSTVTTTILKITGLMRVLLFFCRIVSKKLPHKTGLVLDLLQQKFIQNKCNWKCVDMATVNYKRSFLLGSFTILLCCHLHRNHRSPVSASLPALRPQPIRHACSIFFPAWSCPSRRSVQFRSTGLTATGEASTVNCRWLNEEN